jgi:DNA-directed RNA polymerase subunit RPC12/RpoP
VGKEKNKMKIYMCADCGNEMTESEVNRRDSLECFCGAIVEEARECEVCGKLLPISLLWDDMCKECYNKNVSEDERI